MSAQFLQHARKQALLAEQQGGALRPSRRNVGQNQRLGEAAPRHWSAVRYQICFEVTGRRIVPVIERPVSIGVQSGTPPFFQTGCCECVLFRSLEGSRGTPTPGRASCRSSAISV